MSVIDFGIVSHRTYDSVTMNLSLWHSLRSLDGERSYSSVEIVKCNQIFNQNEFNTWFKNAVSFGVMGSELVFLCSCHKGYVTLVAGSFNPSTDGKIYP